MLCSHSLLQSQSSQPLVSYSLSVFPNFNSHILPTMTHLHVYQAIKGCNSSYDVLIDLLESIEHFLGRLDVYIGLPVTEDMAKVLVKIMVELLCTIALVTRQIKQSRPCECIHAAYYETLTDHDVVKLVKKILRENEVESVLQRLDRLTLDEARATATQTLDIVHGLVQNMRVVMNGEPTLCNKCVVGAEHPAL